jgi:hypothetical protein
MIKIKWGFVPGAVAFALSLLTSLLFARTGFGIALLRAACFGAGFFGLGIAIRALIANFIPDLLFSGRGEDSASGDIFSGGPGSRVNITVEDNPEPALPTQSRGGTEGVEVGTFSDLLSGSKNVGERSESALSGEQYIDQNPETGYTEDQAEESAPVFGKVKLDDIGDFFMDFGAFVSDGTDGTGDMDSFSFFPGVGDSDNTPDAPEPERRPSGNKPRELEGDFDPKEIAAGIRTVLNKEKG